MPDIPEDYYYSSLEAEEIEDRLLHMVPYNKSLNLTDDEKAVFRANIGAGTNNTGLVILGFFETLEDMQESLTTLPKAGDPYGIGLAPPYDIYIYDGYHGVWVNNGPLNPGNTNFDDNSISSSKGWTSNKIFSELQLKQNLLTFDSVPISGSTNPVTSDGVFQYAEPKHLLFTNVEVPVASWVSDTTLEDYPYRAAISLTAVTSDMVPEVNWGFSDFASGIFAGISDSYDPVGSADGGVHVYASELPESAVTIPVIMLWR